MCVHPNQPSLANSTLANAQHTHSDCGFKWHPSVQLKNGLEGDPAIDKTVFNRLQEQVVAAVLHYQSFTF